MMRSGKPPPVTAEVLNNRTEEPWRPFNRYKHCMQHKKDFLCLFLLFTDMFVCQRVVTRSRVYMADLESTLHYSLRVELAAHTVIRGQALVSLKKYISVLTKVKDV